MRANEKPGDVSEFKSVDRDTIQSGPFLLRLTRDKSGKVARLNFTRPLLRDVNFK